jgi:hypothetical protein
MRLLDSMPEAFAVRAQLASCLQVRPAGMPEASAVLI